MNRMIAIAIVGLALTVAGCASKTTNTTTSGTGTTTGTGTAADNSTTDLTCTASPGGVVGGGGSNGATVSGCTIKITSDSVFVKATVPSGCDLSYDDTGDGLSDGSPAAGTTYKSGTSFLFGCGATNPTASTVLSFKAPAA